MNPYSALIGRMIICECIKHIKIPNAKKSGMVIPRLYKVTLTNKSKKRGKSGTCYSYINSEIKVKKNKDSPWVQTTDLGEIEIKRKLRLKYSQDYTILFKGGISGDKMVGECSSVEDKKFSHRTSDHGGQRIKMSCNEFALCYVEFPSKFGLKVIAR